MTSKKHQLAAIAKKIRRSANLAGLTPSCHTITHQFSMEPVRLWWFGEDDLASPKDGLNDDQALAWIEQQPKMGAKMKSRFAFLEKEFGAVPHNIRNSRCAVNHEKKLVIFSAWTDLVENGAVLINGKDQRWTHLENGSKAPGQKDALEKLDLIQNQGYSLRLIWLKVKEPITQPRKIEYWETECPPAELEERSDGWYAILHQHEKKEEK